jgi:hypothetical protein
MHDVQGSIAKDTAAVCIATILLVALLAGAAILWHSPPAPGAQARFQVRPTEVQTAEATPRTPIPPFVF